MDECRCIRWTTEATIKPPSANQMQVRVYAVSINPIDWQMIEGNRRLIAKRSFPFIPLFDFSGVVVALGAAITRFKAGDAVYADNQIDGGAAAKFVNVAENLACIMPASLTFAEAAAVPLAAQTALLALERGRVGPGSRFAS